MTAYNPQIYAFTSLADASRALADLIVDTCLTECAQKGYFTLVVSGGSTPKLLYEMLGKSPWVEKIQWKKTYLFWGDERCVPAGHEQSNFTMVHQTLLSRVPVPDRNIYRIPTEANEPEVMALQYENSLKDFFRAHDEKENVKKFPTFDFFLMGMGDDGHTASLFPGDPALQEHEKWVVSIESSPTEPHLPRISLTLPVINQGKRVAFLVAGERKRQLFREFQNNYDLAAKHYPAAMVGPKGKLLWYVA